MIQCPLPMILPAVVRAEDGDVVEMPLLVPGWQVAALEALAYERGQTAAALLRNLLTDFLRCQTAPL